MRARPPVGDMRLGWATRGRSQRLSAPLFVWLTPRLTRRLFCSQVFLRGQGVLFSEIEAACLTESLCVHDIAQFGVVAIFRGFRIRVSQASVAQLAEQLICNQQVVGSSPSASCMSGGFPERSKGSDCKSDGTAFTGSNPVPPSWFWSIFFRRK